MKKIPQAGLRNFLWSKMIYKHEQKNSVFIKNSGILYL